MANKIDYRSKTLILNISDVFVSGDISSLSIGHASQDVATVSTIVLEKKEDTINIPNRGINLLIDNEGLSSKFMNQDKKSWKLIEKKLKKISSTFNIYAMFATSADKGTVLNISKTLD